MKFNPYGGDFYQNKCGEACKTHGQQNHHLPFSVLNTGTSPDKHFAERLLICLPRAFAKKHKKTSGCKPASFPKHHKIPNIFRYCKRPFLSAL